MMPRHSVHQQSLCDIHVVVRGKKHKQPICLLFGGSFKIHELGWTSVYCSHESLTVHAGQKAFFRIKARRRGAGTRSSGRRLDFEDEGIIILHQNDPKVASAAMPFDRKAARGKKKNFKSSNPFSQAWKMFGK